MIVSCRTQCNSRSSIDSHCILVWGRLHPVQPHRDSALVQLQHGFFWHVRCWPSTQRLSYLIEVLSALSSYVFDVKEAIHVIYFEPISERQTSKFCHEPSMKLVRIDVVGTFWQPRTTTVFKIRLYARSV